ncbi:MAG: chromosome segregation protein SMC [Thermotogae bacterium]|nr:chromosome segregation protein SMC [Thermotogota bacterium]
MLKRIYIKGFKSFAYPLFLSFDNSLTVIVGPNGSGKSNMVDAIKWAFGEQSKKNLRAKDAVDILFNGTPSVSPAPSAHVALTLSLDHRGKVTVERKYSQEKGNEYLLNGEHTKLKTIMNYFAGTGVGREFYSIIGQGEIGMILSASPQKIRLLIEEAARIDKYKLQKSEALKKLASVDKNTTALKTILSGLSQRMKRLYLQAKRSERYEEYSRELKKLKTISYAVKGKNIILKRDSNVSKLTKVKQEMDDMEAEIFKIEAKKESLSVEFSNVDSEIDSFTNTLNEYRTRQETLQKLKDTFRENLSNLEREYIDISSKISYMKNEEVKISKRKEEIKYIYNGILKEYEKAKENLKKLEDEKFEVEEKFKKKEHDVIFLQDELKKNIRRYTTLENEVRNGEDRINDILERKKLITDQLSVKEEKMNVMSSHLDELKKKREIIRTSGIELTSRVKEMASSLKEMEEHLETAVAKKNELDKQKSSATSKLELLKKWKESYEGFAQPVKVIFELKKNNKGLDGICDVVANIIDVPQEYEMAVWALVGNRAQNIVTKDAETAKFAISILKSHDLGRVTFLPMDLMKATSRSFSTLPKDIKGIRGYARDLISFDDKYKGVISYLFRNAVIVDILDTAIYMRRNLNLKQRIATLGGELMDTGGAITGGSMKGNRYKMISRNREIADLEGEVSHLNSQLSSLENSIARTKKELTSLTAKYEKNEKQLRQANNEFNSLEKMISDMEKQLYETTDEVKSLQNMSNDYSGRIEEMRTLQDTRKEELHVLDRKRRNLEENLNAESQTIGEERDKLAQLDAKITDWKMKTSVLEEKKKRYEEEIKRLNASKDNMLSEAGTLSARKEKLSVEMERVNGRLKEVTKELRTIENDVTDLFETVNFKKKDKVKKLETIKKIDDELVKKNKMLEKIRKDGRDLEIAVKEYEIRLEGVKNNILGLGYSEQEIDEVIAKYGKQEINGKESEKRIAELEQKMKYLGAVNPMAPAEYEEVKEEFDTLNEKVQDIVKAKKVMTSIMDVADKKAKSIFLEVFERIKEEFNSMIKVIFEGAEGDLRLEGEEDILESGVEIVVKHFHRRNQHLQMMSGGEKTLVGIALLFSLLKVNPSPFYVLDEIDAALDDFNVERFKRLLKQYSRKTQFIVITHNKLLMEGADILYGVTMDNGVSKVISVDFKKVSSESPVAPGVKVM